MKRRWMCSGCEGALGRLEKQFAEQLFVPVVNARPAPYRYGPWLAPFLASIAWRALLYSMESPAADSMTAEERALIPACEERWRSFAAGEVADAGQYELHFIPMGLATLRNPTSWTPSLNFYTMRSVEIHVAGCEIFTFVYAKMGPTVALGFIKPPPPGLWRGTLVAPGGGFLGGSMAVPEVFLAYYKEKAMQGRGLLTGLSNREKRKISDAQRRDMKRAAASETFRAIAADVETFGADRVFSDDSGTTERV